MSQLLPPELWISAASPKLLRCSWLFFRLGLWPLRLLSYCMFEDARLCNLLLQQNQMGPMHSSPSINGQVVGVNAVINIEGCCKEEEEDEGKETVAMSGQKSRRI
ncbi:hypothetical protein XENORESO_021025 [Xenotaenia resolanae]|uniref:Uncharacterized protein n=1 Tax=Xenotaenia resolanae TaxID=208358 RepID=A0ABV0WUH4_9TELE